MSQSKLLPSAVGASWPNGVPVAIARIVERMRYYSNDRLRFVVFAHGTCVLVTNNSQSPVEEAKSSLASANFGHVDFNPRTMDDQNFLVGFGEHVCGVVLADDLHRHREYIDGHHLDGRQEYEVLMTAGQAAKSFDDRGKAGLLACARLFLDANELLVVQIFEPKQ